LSTVSTSGAAAHLRALSLLAEAIGGTPVSLELTAFHAARSTLPRLKRTRPGQAYSLRSSTTALALPCARAGWNDDDTWRRALRLSVLRSVLCNAAREPGKHPTRDRRSLLEQWLDRLLQRTWVDRLIRLHYPGAVHDLDFVLALTRQRLGSSANGALRQILQALTRSLIDAAQAGGASGYGRQPGRLSPGVGNLPLQPADPELTAAVSVDGVLEPQLLAQVIQRSQAVLWPDATLQDCAQAAAEIHQLLVARFPGSRPSLRTLTVVPVAMPAEASASNASSRMQGVNLQGHEQTEAGKDRGRSMDPGQDRSGEGSVANARASQQALAGSVGTTTSQAGEAAEPEGEEDPAIDDAPQDAMTLGPADPVVLSSRYGAGAGEAVGVYLIDEWDCHAGRYLPAWCRLTEWRLRGPERDLLHEVRRDHPELARQILERFAALRPVSYRRVKGVPDGDDLDLDGVVHAMIDRRAGSSSDERAWIRRERRDRDVSTALLLDMSASTSLSLPAPVRPVAGSSADPVSQPLRATDLDTTRGALLYGFYDDTPQTVAEQPRRRIIDVARDSLALMALGLATLGDDHAIYGFSGSGRDNVEFHVARDFDDPWRQRSLGSALAAIEPRGSTRMGPAIRHATHKLARRPALQRLLILVSDGYPQDIDYGPDRNDEGYGLQDTARALREAQRAGVSTFCVTIDPAGHDYLRRMCTPEGYRVIDDVHALPQALSEIYARLTGRA